MRPVLRFLATGDIQAHEFKPFSTVLPNGMNSRLANILKVFGKIKRTCQKTGITKVLLNGDIFEESDYIPTETYTSVYDAAGGLHDDGLDVVANIGNHDIALYSQGRVIHSLSPFRRVARVISSPRAVWGGRVLVIPWMSPPEALLASIKPPKGHPRVLVLHVGVQGAVTGPKRYLVRNPIKLEDIRPKEFDLILLSDFHTSQFLRKNVMYLGSPLQHNFGEVHNPAIWEVNLYDREPYFRLRPIYTNLPRFITIEASAVSDSVERLAGNYVKVIRSNQEEISEQSLDALARKYDFQYRIETQSSKQAEQSSEVKTFEPERFIRRYAKANADPRDKHRLSDLGQRLYRGDVE